MTAIIVTSRDQSALRSALGEAIVTFAVVSNIYGESFFVPPSDDKYERTWRHDHFVDYLKAHPKLEWTVVSYGVKQASE